MTKPSQPAMSPPRPCLWMRLLAVLSLLVVLVGSSAQAHHVHGVWLSEASVASSTQWEAVSWSQDEASCLLCAAMHSAMPCGIQAYEGTAPAVGGLVTPTTDWVALRRLPFWLLSRPPPGWNLFQFAGEFDAFVAVESF